MDPNANLAVVRRLAASILDGERDLADSLAEHVQALDEWLSRGGFLPSAWRTRPPHERRYRPDGA